MQEILGIPLSVATPSALALSAIAIIVLSFVRGWIMSKFAVEQVLQASASLITQSNARADEYKQLYLTEKERGDVLQSVVEELKIVGKSTAKILESLPPITGDMRNRTRTLGDGD